MILLVLSSHRNQYIQNQGAYGKHKTKETLGFRNMEILIIEKDKSANRLKLKVIGIQMHYIKW